MVADLLIPVVLMFVLTGAVLSVLGVFRFSSVAKGKVGWSYFKLFENGVGSDQLQQAKNNFQNLFELPVLFYLIVMILIVTNQVAEIHIAMAWVFFVSRAIHSLVHLTSNYVPFRATAYLIGCGALLVLWGSWVLEFYQ